MPQQILPLIPRGATEINGLVSVWRDVERWTYFMGTYPIYSHDKTDQHMFRLITSQMIESGACRQVDVTTTFGVSKSSVIRSVNKLRKGGAKAFFVQRRGRRGGKVLTPEVIKKAQSLLDQGYTRRDVSQELTVRYDTIRKAINDDRLREPKQTETGTSKSSRNVVDAAAAEGMGVACTRVEERVLASMGKLVGATRSTLSCAWMYPKQEYSVRYRRCWQTGCSMEPSSFLAKLPATIRFFMCCCSWP